MIKRLYKEVDGFAGWHSYRGGESQTDSSWNRRALGVISVMVIVFMLVIAAIAIAIYYIWIGISKWPIIGAILAVWIGLTALGWLVVIIYRKRIRTLEALKSD